MQIQPNVTHLNVEIQQVKKQSSGWGSDVHARVLSVPARKRGKDFIGVKEGDALEFFAADDRQLVAGGKFAISASLQGDARGQKVVLQTAKPLRE